MNNDEQIRRLSRAADWRAARTVLSGAFDGHTRVWQHVDFGKERICFGKILKDGTFSYGERTLLAVAVSLFNQDHSVNLWQTFNRLDDTSAALVLKAIESFCGGPE